MDPYGLIGQVLDGQFRVDQYVGEGGFSVVYKGLHLGLEEPIALKCLKLPSSLGSALVESFVRRFRDESRIHYRLSQGNLHICRSIASGTTIAPATSALVPYMVLEWLEGQSLAQEFDARRAAGMTGRPLAEAVKMLDPAVEALAYAHAQGVVHRDLNTGNLFLARTREGSRLKVLDFGVAKIVSDHALEMGPRAQTIGQIRIFAPAYGAPEQFEDKVGPVGPWTDVYALALILLEALRDRTVMEGEHIGEYAMKALDERVRPTPRTLGIAVGEEVEVTLGRAVALNPRQRPQDAGELWGMLKNAMRRDGESGRPPHASPAQGPRGVSGSGRASVAPPVAVLPSGSSPAVEVLRPGSIVPPPGAGSLPPGAMASPSGRAPARTVRMSTAPPVPDASGSFPPAPAVPHFGQSAPVQIDPAISGVYGSTPPPGAALDAAHGPTAVRPSPLASSLGGGPMPAGPWGSAPSPANPPLPFPGPGAHGGGYGPPPSALPSRDVSLHGAGPVTAVVGVGGPSRRGLVLGLIVVGLALLAGVAYGIVRGSASAPVAPLPESATATAPTATSATAPLASVAPATGPAAAPAMAVVVQPASPNPTAVPSATAMAPVAAPPSPTPGLPTAAPTPGLPTAAPTPGLPTANPAVPFPPPTATVSPASRAFDPTASRAALDVVNGILASCRRPGGASGQGHVTVRFRNDGTVESAAIDKAPYVGTPEALCVESRFRTAKTKAFDGPAAALDYAFVVPK